MPVCKYCHKTIDRVSDRDLCPYCGGKNPIDEDYETKDITQFVKPVSKEYELYKSRSKMVASFLCLFLGLFGAHRFYLGFWKKGLIILITSLLFIAAIGSALYFGLGGELSAPVSYVIPFAVLFLGYALYSIRLFLGESLKDQKGEYLR